MDELADAITGAAPDLDSAGQRLFIATYRLLAAGHPVTTAELAAAAGLAEPAAAGALRPLARRVHRQPGAGDRVLGLALGELSPAHRFETGGRVLYAWCAWDTLFLPARLGQDAHVTSACPATGELIELTVGPDGISATSHPAAVVSFLLPDGPFDSGVVQSFCHFVHFFATRQAGDQWAASHPGTFLLTLGEAADLAARVNQRMFPDVLGTAP